MKYEYELFPVGKVPFGKVKYCEEAPLNRIPFCDAT
jgi:hypothetical protein